MVLEEQHPDVASEFHKGNFVIHKSLNSSLSFTSHFFFVIHKVTFSLSFTRHFSAMAIGRAHEQNNAVIKGDGVLLA